MPKFNVYAGEIAGLGEVAVIITTAYTNAGGYPRAEYFLIIPDDKCTGYAHRLFFDVQSFQDSPIELNEQLMLAEALNQARIDLRLYLAKSVQGSGIALPHAGPAIIEDNSNLLVHLWLRGKCAERIVEVASKTDYPPLKDLLRAIAKLPTISKQGL